jgi:polysaccharide export outer membrane protein
LAAINASHSRRGAVSLACLAAAVGLTACSGLPNDGPSTSAVVHSAEGAQAQSAPSPSQYVLVDLTPSVVTQLAVAPKDSLRSVFGDDVSPDINKIQPGDFVSVTLWDVSATDLLANTATVGAAPTSGGVPSPSLAQGASVPDQIVAADGTITIPFAGRIAVAGLTSDAAASAIESSLRRKAVKPQAIVSITHDNADTVTVTGDDIKDGAVQLAPNSDRLLDAIAASGGALSPTYQTQVKLVRNGRQSTASLQNILADPTENIHLYPHDILVVSKNSNFFTAVGAVGTPSQIQFAYERVSLAQAMGLAGGLQDQRADAKGVFVFRFETREMAAKVCGACATGAADQVPIVYRLDLERPQSLFVAQDFYVQNHDVVFVSNAPKAQLQKMLSLIGSIASPVSVGATLGTKF